MRTSAARTALVGKPLEGLLSLGRPKRRTRSCRRGSSLQSSLASLFDESVQGSLNASKALVAAPVDDVANILAELNEVIGLLKLLGILTAFEPTDSSVPVPWEPEMRTSGSISVVSIAALGLGYRQPRHRAHGGPLETPIFQE